MNTPLKRLTVVLYDGIQNSVFESQVLAPLLVRLGQEPVLEVYLISFERYKLSPDIVRVLIPSHERLHFTSARRIFFWGRSSLCFSVWQLMRLLMRYFPHEIMARGPFAGWIVCNALRRLLRAYKKDLPAVTIQARGLAAEEFRFTREHKKQPGLFVEKMTLLRYKQFKRLERSVFRKRAEKDMLCGITIETVSTYLKKYLVDELGADPEKISIAQRDIPRAFLPATISNWREIIRTELGLKQEAFVYCYNGSARPWQCAHETVEYFVQQYRQDPSRALLVLSQEKETFEQLLTSVKLPETSYRVLSVKSDQIYKYLAACDAGLLFRKQDIVNWVSRPTKMLEYQAVGLKIIHNNTVGCLVDSK